MYQDIEVKFVRIIIEAIRIVNENDKKLEWCSGQCLDCLVAEARGNDDAIPNHKISYRRGDLAMFDAKRSLISLDMFKGWNDCG